MALLLEVEDLHVRYGHIHALQGVTLHVGEGEIVTLIGPNGAGKSTLINTVSGILRPAAGMVRYLGSDTRRASIHGLVAQGLVQVPEGRAILGTLTVRENLELGGAALRDRRSGAANVERALDLFPALRERASQLGATLSGGEQQMLAIARALVAQPRVLLMDEPSLGLAPRVVNQIFRTIGELRRAGIAILLVEQNAHKALDCADRGYLLEHGQLVVSGSAPELAANPLVSRVYLGAAAP